MTTRECLGPQLLLFILACKQFGFIISRLLLGNNILFEDVLGRRKNLPVEFFQYYDVFSTFLRKSFQGFPREKYVVNISIN